MLEFFAVVTRGGLVLWSFTVRGFNGRAHCTEPPFPYYRRRTFSRYLTPLCAP